MGKTFSNVQYRAVAKDGIRSGMGHDLPGKPVGALEDWELEQLAVRQPMRARGVYKQPGRYRLNTMLARRWLGKQAGKLWTEVRSVIAQKFGDAKMDDLRQYLLRMVDMETVDGRKVSDFQAYPEGFKGFDFWVDRGGVFRCDEEALKAERAKERLESRYKREQELASKLIVRKKGELVHLKVGGVWYAVSLEDVVEVARKCAAKAVCHEVDTTKVVEYEHGGKVERYVCAAKVTPTGGSGTPLKAVCRCVSSGHCQKALLNTPSRDVVTGKVWRYGPSLCDDKYGEGSRGKYAAKKVQLSHAELKAYGLTND